MNLLKNNIKAFTLIELLIVISIIGLLTAMSIFALQGARESARDSRRKADLESIRSALEIYRADCGIYPSTLGSQITGVACSPVNTNVYMEEVPRDPQGAAYAYRRLSTTQYTLCSVLEQIPNPPNNVANCGSCLGGICQYRVLNP